MANIKIKHLSGFDLNNNELNDLINKSVCNAIERRNQLINSKDTLLTLSNEEASKIVGLGGKIVVVGKIYTPEL